VIEHRHVIFVLAVVKVAKRDVTAVRSLLLHSVLLQPIVICKISHYDNAPESSPRLAENKRDVDVGRALNFVEVHY